MNKFLSDDRVRLRAIEPSDLTNMYIWENDTNIWQNGCTIEPYSRATLQSYIDNQGDLWSTKQLRLAIETIDGNKTIGTIDLFDVDALHKRAGIGILIGELDYRGKGFASAALALLISFCKDYLGFHQLHCTIVEDNENSIKLFKNKGFEQTGVLKQWICYSNQWKDVYQYQLIF